MELNELESHEKQALVGLVRLAVGKDGTVSQSEADGMAAVADGIGHEEFDAISDELDSMTEDVVRQLARDVKRTDARELIYGTLFEVMIPGTIVSEEAKLLDWLQEIWDIQSEPA